MHALSRLSQTPEHVVAGANEFTLTGVPGSPIPRINESSLVTPTFKEYAPVKNHRVVRSAYLLSLLVAFVLASGAASKLGH